MKSLIIGTTNEAKVTQIRGALKPLGIEVTRLPKSTPLPTIVEDGSTAQENARKKALTYAKAINQPILSMDNALYLEGLEPEKQPGLNVRRIPGSMDRPTDEQMLGYYAKLIDQLGSQINGKWEFAICIAFPDGILHETTIVSPRIFVSQMSKARVPGYPLESIQIEPTTGKYVSEMSQAEQDAFWQATIGKELCEFVKNSSL